MTFFEVPNEEAEAETPHRVREWYAGRSVEATIRAALERGGLGATVEELGESPHGEKGTRKLFKITRADPQPSASPEAIAAYIAKAGQAARPRLYRRLRLWAGGLKRSLLGRR